MKNLLISLLALAALTCPSCKKADNAPSSISFDKTNYSITVGMTIDLTVFFLPSGTSGTLVWSSDNQSVASVNSKGTVTGLKVGSAMISARCGSLSCYCNVKVVDGEPEDDRPGFSMRIMQFNILQGKDEPAGHEWSSVRKEPCFKMLNETAPDIICFEEARKTQCNDLASKFPQYSQVKHPKDNIESNGGQRDLIMYRSDKFDLLDWDKYWFSVDETSSGDRFCPAGVTNSTSKTTQKLTVWAHFRENVSKRDFYVFCTHFFADVDELAQRTKCVELSLTHIKAIDPKTPVFFCGDLNINYCSENGRALLAPMFEYMESAAVSADMHDSPTATTYNKFGASTSVLDYIFYRNATALTYKIINSAGYGTEYISDHYPVCSDFRVGK